MKKKTITRKQYFDAIKTIHRYSEQNDGKMNKTHEVTALAFAVDTTWAKELNKNIYYCQHCQEEAKLNQDIKHLPNCIVVGLRKYLNIPKYPVKEIKLNDVINTEEKAKEFMDRLSALVKSESKK